MIKYFDKLYVGMRNDQPGVQKIPLGFATPYGEDAAFKKRKETVDQWTNYYSHNPRITSSTTIIDNVPMSGFSTGKSVSRYSTSNKLIRVADPRGFELEISIDNLSSLLAETVIDHGVIQEPLIWGRDGAVNVLTTVKHPDYIHAQTVAGPIEVEPGQTFLDTNGHRYIFRGKYWCYFDWTETTYPDGHYGYGNYGRSRQNPIVTRKTLHDTKPWFVYEDADRTYRNDEPDIRRSKMPASKLADPATPKIDLSEMLEVHEAQRYGRKAKFFSDLKLLKQYKTLDTLSKEHESE